MKVRITHNYCYLNEEIVDMWYIQGIPFTFEELPVAVQQLEEVGLDAEKNQSYTLQDMYRLSGYLVEEECHPILYDLSDWVENFHEVRE
tara:strand:- start:690 stop:956 length:267 start_codon:yes stop_codon:yes gene_type:complete